MNILESKSTPSIIRDILDALIPEIDKLLNTESNYISIDIDKSHIINSEKKVCLKCHLTINFYLNSINYNGDINFNECIYSNFKNCIINIYSPKNLDKKHLYKSILHGLTHLYELYQIKDIFNKSSWVKSKNLFNFDLATKELNFKPIEYFRNLYYVSLPHEVRATISSVEIFLCSLQTKDIDFMNSELVITNEYKRYLGLLEFNPIKFKNDLLDIYDEVIIIKIFNLFNKINKINFIINNEYDILKYFKSWDRYFKHISKKFEEKFSKKIKEISNNSKEEYPNLGNPNILPYDDYIKETKRDKKLEDILLFIDFNSFLNH